MKLHVHTANFAYLRARSRRCCSIQGDRVRVAVIGSDVPALVLALKLVKDHTVTVVEQEAEIGMPVHHPGRVFDLDLLSQYIPSSHHTILQLQQNDVEYGCRWEWVIKLLTIECSTQGVNFETRSRITSMVNGDSGTRLNFNHSQTKDWLEVDAVVDMNIVQDLGPGKRTHSLNHENLVAWGRPETAAAQGVLVPTAHLEELSPPDPAFVVGRADAQTEIWWYGTAEWEPAKGVLERMTGRLPLNPRLVSFDGCVLLAERVHKGMEVTHI